jgi:hypothetical protein
MHIPLGDDEPIPTTCFMDCDCAPVLYVRADEVQRLRGLIADLCDPEPGCWQRALAAGRAEVAA